MISFLFSFEKIKDFIERAAAEEEIRLKKEIEREREKENLSRKLVYRSSIQIMSENVEKYKRMETENHAGKKQKNIVPKQKGETKPVENNEKHTKDLISIFSGSMGNLGRKSIFEMSLRGSFGNKNQKNQNVDASRADAKSVIIINYFNFLFLRFKWFYYF